MSTNTFERKITISDPESLEKLFRIINEKDSNTKQNNIPLSDKEIERSEQLLNLCLSHSGF